MAGKRKINDDNIRVNLDLNASDAEKNIHRLTQATKELKAQNAAHRKEISALAATEGDHSKEIAGLNELIKANSRAIRQNDKDIARWEKEIDITYKTTAQLKKHLKGLNKELDNTSRSLHPQEYEKLRKEIEETQKALDVANGKTEGLKRSFMSLAGMKEVVSGFFLAVGAAVLTFITGKLKEAISTIVDFEKANSKLAAVLGTTKARIRDLTAEALRLGATTSYTASEISSLQLELAKLGFSKEQIKDMEAGVLKFAQAVDTDLGSAASFAGAAGHRRSCRKIIRFLDRRYNRPARQPGQCRF